MKSEELNEALRGYTIVRRLEFAFEVQDGCCTLTLELTKSNAVNEEVLTIEFIEVAGLSLKDFGGGLTQLLLLHVDNIVDQQLDRTNYEVRELEDETFTFVCRDFHVTNR